MWGWEKNLYSIFIRFVLKPKTFNDVKKNNQSFECKLLSISIVPYTIFEFL
jgi:hypothetical protein